MYPPVLKTKRCILKPYTPEDENRFVDMSLDATSILYMGGASGNEMEERKLFRKIFDIYQSNNNRWFWIWGIYQDNLLCGHLEMKETNHTNDKELEIVYMIHPDARRKGIITEILSLLKQKQKSWQKRIIATVNPENFISISLLQKWGIDTKETLINDETNEAYFKLTLTQ